MTSSRALESVRRIVEPYFRPECGTASRGGKSMSMNGYYAKYRERGDIREARQASKVRCVRHDYVRVGPAS